MNIPTRPFGQPRNEAHNKDNIKALCYREIQPVT